jgi:hypothetical protein
MKRQMKYEFDESALEKWFFTSFKANDKMQPKTWNEAHWKLKKTELKSKTKSHIETLFQFVTTL